MRVVSLLPSATEIVCELEMGEHLVGRSHECDHPPAVRELPACTEPKFEADGTSYEVDQRVRALLQEGLSVYRVDADRLRNLRPDLILTQDHCRVCAALLDGHSYFNRPGPRLVESLEILAEILPPPRFDFGHGGRARSRADVG